MTQHTADTDPKKPTELDAYLRAQEPPTDADDTPPSGMTALVDPAAQLRADEPPITADDTNPSLVMRPAVYPQQSPPTRQRTNQLHLLVILGLLAGAAILTTAAAYLYLSSDDNPPISKTAAAEEAPAMQTDDRQRDAVQPDNNQPNNSQAEIDQPNNSQPDTTLPDRAIEATTATPTHTPQFVNQGLPEPTTTPVEPHTPRVLPTAAAEEIAAALVKPVAVEPPADTIVRNSAPFTIRSATNRTDIVQYAIQDGDTLESIAAKFGLDDIYTLIWSNPRNKYTTLRPGTQLTILPEDGVYHEITEPITIADLAETYQVTPYAIIDAEYNNLFGSLPETLLPPGMWVAVPGGEGERVNFFAPVVQTTTDSGNAATGAVSGTYNLWGCTSTIGGGTAPYGRPLQYYQWMQGFTLGGHEGVDLSGNIGDPVFAAGGGTVAYAGWNNTGYGNVVVIAHGTTFSLYAHLNGYNVSCGQSVSTGSVIGSVGTSGNSSGPHLHFEIRDANWGAHNPQNYIGF